MVPTRIVLADDHHVVRAAVASFLNREPDMEVVGEVGDTQELECLMDQLLPDVLVLDAHMPGQNVVKMAQKLSAKFPATHLLVLSAYDRREYVVGLLGAGVSGYVLKDDSPETLVKAVRMVARGEEWLSPRVVSILMRSIRDQEPLSTPGLTEREMEVLCLMAEGLKNDEIAGRLFITSQTVKNHIHSIFNKLDVDSRVGAVLYALNHDLITDQAEN